MAELRAKIMLVDDHALFRESVARFLSHEAGLEVVGSFAGINEALEQLRRQPADVVLLDFDLGEHNGVDFVRLAFEAGYKGKVLVVTAGVDSGSAAELLRRGVAGVFFKHDPPALLVQALQEILAGHVWFNQAFLQKAMGATVSSPRSRQLTGREKQVLVAVFEGLANKQIADRLQVSESAVKATLQQLFEKTGVRTRGQLVRIALEQYRELI
jgi:two-component system nitrate/nitrite response regulator NarL